MMSTEVQFLVDRLTHSFDLTVLMLWDHNHRDWAGPSEQLPESKLWDMLERIWNRLAEGQWWGQISNLTIQDVQGRSWICQIRGTGPEDGILLAIGPVNPGEPWRIGHIMSHLATAGHLEEHHRPQRHSLGRATAVVEAIRTIRRTYHPALLAAIREGNPKRVDEILFETVQRWRLDGVRSSDSRLRHFIGAFIASCEGAAIQGGVDPLLAERQAELCLRILEATAVPQEAVVGILPMIRGFADYVSRVPLQGKSGPVRTVSRYIRENLHRMVSLKEAAAEARVSVSYAAALLKRESGKNFTETVKWFRVERAQQLLRSTDASVQEIANQVGYRQADHFSRVFQSLVGLSPREYRRSATDISELSGKNPNHTGTTAQSSRRY
jgi:AraC-like DNA-binding protein